MEKEFIPYELAVKLKALGFDEPCAACYYKKFDNEIGYHKVYRDFNFVQLTVSAPTYSQAFRWFREKGFICHVTNDLSNNLQDEVYVYVMTKGYGSLIDRSEEYSTYEEAELACLDKLLEIINL